MPIKTIGEKGAWAYPAAAQIFLWRIKLWTSNFVRTYLCKYDRSHLLTISRKIAVGEDRDSRKFSGNAHWAHRAVIFAIARLFVKI